MSKRHATCRQSQSACNRNAHPCHSVPVTVVLFSLYNVPTQAVSGQMSNADISDQQITAAADATYKRLQLLQDHLCSYAERNVPVVTLDLANFSDTMEHLHDYLLQCIESAMQQC